MRRAELGVVIASCVAPACGATAEPLFSVASDAGVARDGGVGAAQDAASPYLIRPGLRLQYQLTGAFDPEAAADVFVIDLFETKRTDIERLHALGRVAVAYVAAGSYESWRPDVDALPEATIGNALSRYPEEAWLDVRHPSVRQLLVGRLTLAVDKGFDGVLLASLDAYRANSGHDLSAADQLAYNVWLAQRADQVGLAAGISSDWEQADSLAEHFGFALDVGCIADGQCAALMPYVRRGRAVFDIETDGDSAAVCAEARTLNFPVALKHAQFDGWLEHCP
ncbi:MAG: hypothetical protein RL385_1972 [Pseudomonadota bacterium]|jgi:hypothetical protein